MGVNKGAKDIKSRRRKRSLLHRLSEMLDMPPQVIPNCSETVITLSENMSLSISSCKKIMRYDEDAISLLFGKYTLDLTGERLSLRSCRDGSLELTGIIDSIRFDRNCKK